jgi:hypothetical protein
MDTHTSFLSGKSLGAVSATFFFNHGKHDLADSRLETLGSTDWQLCIRQAVR